MSIVLQQPEIERLGSSLRQIDRSLLRHTDNVGTARLWYQGGEPYFDVFFDLKDNQLVWFQLTLRGKSVSWSQKSLRLQTGTTNESRTDDVSYYSASKLIQTNHQADRSFIELARSILQTRAGEVVFDQALALFDQEPVRS